MSDYKTKFHQDHTVTVWNVHTQQWQRTGDPSDAVLASLDPVERDRVIEHVADYEHPDGDLD